MFIIARRRGQRIEIGDDISITVTDISRNAVKLGIEAPRDCLIARGELKESVVLTNREAALSRLSPGDHGDLQGEADDTGARAEAFPLATVKTLTARDVINSTDKQVADK